MHAKVTTCKALVCLGQPCSGKVLLSLPFPLIAEQPGRARSAGISNAPGLDLASASRASEGADTDKVCCAEKRWLFVSVLAL